ncbi:PhzF family phenazine biosynthesis protein [Veronia pacifica]|uniref:Phenazine biosynthesis protein PhzF family n=1 Tax=Veronia pacifica TaxID=1080227 RepID=A0A1C3EKM4_9GAMM|nr:PhzF family phenazine biosynthesis protein [Veronia pacifica]ODA33788.1 phenazine biosynthesis protein PhzF family [Veronia pacifica]
MADYLEVYRSEAFVADGQGGNTAGVVLNAEHLTDQQMQSIAAELGFSETAFMMPSKKADYQVRFFTPEEEVDFCGHATVAAFSTVFKLGKQPLGHYTQQTKAGLLGVEITEDGRVVMEQVKPSFGKSFQPEDIVDLFGLTTKDILATGMPIKDVSTGLADIIVPLADKNVLSRLKPDFKAIAAFNKRTKTCGFHLFALTPHESDISAKCRNFAPVLGIDEESATGSAAGALAAYLYRYQGTRNRYVFEQGAALAKRSLLYASVVADGEDIKKIHVGGASDKPQRVPYRLTRLVS